MQTESLSLEFISQFNELDKYLEGVLNDCDQHMNFAHKLKLVSQGHYQISNYIKKHFFELNYLGDLRNQLVHGLGLSGQDYVLPTNHALSQLHKHYDNVINFKEYQCIVSSNDLVTTVVESMLTGLRDDITIYDHNKHIATISWQELLQAIVSHKTNMVGVTIGDLALQHNI